VAKKIPPVLHEFIKNNDLPARLVQQLDALRRQKEAEGKKKRKRGRPPKEESRPWLAHRDFMVDLAALAEVLKHPPRNAAKKIAQLTHPRSGKGPFKGRRGLRDSMNRMLREVRNNQGLEKALKTGLRDQSATLYIRPQAEAVGVPVDVAAEAWTKFANFCEKLKALSPAEKKEYSDLYYAAEPLFERLLATKTPEEYQETLDAFEAGPPVGRGLEPTDKLMTLLSEYWRLLSSGAIAIALATLNLPSDHLCKK
jgi:hypothetical protein